MGFGYPIDQPDLHAMTEKGSGIFREAVLLVADALGVELDDVRCEVEYAQTTEDSTCRVTGRSKRAVWQESTSSWKGFVGEREVVEVRAAVDQGTDAGSRLGDATSGYTIRSRERPTIKTTLASSRHRTSSAETLDDYIMLGLTITAMPAITAIPAVVAAPPGIATYNDLPLLLPRGVLAAS